MSFAASAVRARNFSSELRRGSLLACVSACWPTVKASRSTAFGEALGEVDQDHQRIGVQLPDGAGILRALEFLHLGGHARGYGDHAQQHSGGVRPRARLFEVVGGVRLEPQRD